MGTPDTPDYNVLLHVSDFETAKAILKQLKQYVCRNQSKKREWNWHQHLAAYIYAGCKAYGSLHGDHIMQSAATHETESYIHKEVDRYLTELNPDFHSSLKGDQNAGCLIFKYSSEKPDPITGEMRQSTLDDSAKWYCDHRAPQVRAPVKVLDGQYSGQFVTPADAYIAEIKVRSLPAHMNDNPVRRKRKGTQELIYRQHLAAHRTFSLIWFEAYISPIEMWEQLTIELYFQDDEDRQRWLERASIKFPVILNHSYLVERQYGEVLNSESLKERVSPTPPSKKRSLDPADQGNAPGGSSKGTTAEVEESSAIGIAD